LIEIGSKTAEKNSAQTNKQTDRQTHRQTDTTKIMVTWPWTNTTWSGIRVYVTSDSTPNSVATYVYHDLRTRSLSCTDSGCRRVLTAFGWWLDQWTRVCDKPCKPATGQMQRQFILRDRSGLKRVQ